MSLEVGLLLVCFVFIYYFSIERHLLFTLNFLWDTGAETLKQMNMELLTLQEGQPQLGPLQPSFPVALLLLQLLRQARTA